MTMPKISEGVYPNIGDPSRSMLRFIDSPDGGQGVNPDDFKVVGGEGQDAPSAAPAAQPAAPAEPAAPAAPPAAPQEPAAPATPPAPPAEPGAPAAPPAADAMPWGDDKDFDPEKAKRLILNLRGDKAKAEQKIAEARAEATTQAQKDLVTKLAKELGVIEEPKNPEDLLTAVSQERDTLKQSAAGMSTENKLLKVENNVYRIGDRLGANIDAVLDSRELEKKFLALDPAADDFASQVEAVVKTAVTENPNRYRKAQVAPVSGGDFSGGNGGGAPAPADKDDIEEIRKDAAKRKEGRA